MPGARHGRRIRKIRGPAGSNRADRFLLARLVYAAPRGQVRIMPFDHFTGQDRRIFKARTFASVLAAFEDAGWRFPTPGRAMEGLNSGVDSLVSAEYVLKYEMIVPL